MHFLFFIYLKSYHSLIYYNFREKIMAEFKKKKKKIIKKKIYLKILSYDKLT
jgi:hypothetical protein